MGTKDKNGSFWAMFAKQNGQSRNALSRQNSRTPSSSKIKMEVKQESVEEAKEDEKPLVEFKSKKRKRVVIKNDEYDQLQMCGVQVRVPVGLKPYPTQKLIMVRILTALKNEFNVLAESPTGSGKTMALLASTCGWLKMYQDERKSSRNLCKIHGEFSSQKLENTENSTMAEDVTINEGPSTTEKQDAFENQWLEDFVPYAEAKFSTKLEKEEDLAAEDPKQYECTCLPRVRIYYGTRTHKQISQVVKEFGRLPYADIIKHTILASREQSCINPTARKSQDISQYCKEVNAVDGIGCQFKVAMRNRFEKAGAIRSHLYLNGTIVFDTEEVVSVLATSSPQLCPYFSTTRVLTQDADLIFCPFSYLVDPIIRNSSDVHLKNSVVILDEAHNIEDTCREAASFSFTEKELDDALLSYRLKKHAIDIEIEAGQSHIGVDNFEEKLNEKMEKLKETRQNLIAMEHLMLEIMRWVRKVAQGAKEQKNGRDGVRTCTLSNTNLFSSLTDVEQGIDLYTPQNTPKHSNILNAFNSLAAHNEGDMQYLDAFKPNAIAIVCVEKWMYFQSYFGQPQYQMTYRGNVTIEPIQSAFGRSAGAFNSTMEFRQKSGAGPKNMRYGDDDFSNDSHDGVSVWLNDSQSGDTWIDPSMTPNKTKPIADGCKTTISLWCMSPALSFIDAFNETRSVILASGTLCPMDTLKTELGMEFRQQMEGDQVIAAERIFAAVLPIGPYGNRLQCTYKHTSDGESPFYTEVGAIIRYVCVNVSAGILCFVPSYRVLDNLRGSMEKSSCMRQIEMKKKVLFEPRRSSELASVMNEFDDAIANPHRFGKNVTGALMFAVFRGKVSEGIDFADDKARVVISIGIPFPSATDELVNAKRLYNDENSKELGILNGEEWYVTQAYRALNQALGRCLRHKNDWGAMLMIDERLEKQAGKLTTGAASARVSKWIRSQLKSYPSFKQFDSKFREFFERMTMPEDVKNVVVKKENVEL